MAKSVTPEDHGGKPIEYDPDFNGPLRNRSCTDIICLLLFLIFIGCWVGVGIFAYVNGDTDLLLIPRDSQGSRCGFDPHVKTKPYLFFFDITKCIGPNVPFTGCKTPQVCVEKCPDKTFIWERDRNVRDLICTNGINSAKLSDREAQALIDNGNCTKWYLKSEQVLKRCLYNVGEQQSPYSRNLHQPTGETAAIRKHLEMAGSILSLIVHKTIGLFTDSRNAHQVYALQKYLRTSK